jgi:DNA-binding protein H-NS
MWIDEIVEEIHQIREEYAKSFNYDLDEMFADLRKKEAASGRKVVTLSRKPGITTRWSGRTRDPDGEAKNTSRRSN